MSRDDDLHPGMMHLLDELIATDATSHSGLNYHSPHGIFSRAELDASGGDWRVDDHNNVYFFPSAAEPPLPSRSDPASFWRKFNDRNRT